MALKPFFALGPPPQAVATTYDQRTNQYVVKPNVGFYIWCQRLYEWTKTLGNNIDGDASFSGSIAIGTSPNWFKADSSGIWLGGATFGASPFRVSMAGAITGTSGTIGGFTLGATTLTATAGGNTTIVSSGTTAFTAGPTGSPLVTITQAGILSATSVDISALSGSAAISVTGGTGATAVNVTNSASSAGIFTSTAGNVTALTADNSTVGSYATAKAFWSRVVSTHSGAIAIHADAPNGATAFYCSGPSTFVGNVSASSYTITATTFSGALSGNATTATTATTGTNLSSSGNITGGAYTVPNAQILSYVSGASSPGGTGFAVGAETGWAYFKAADGTNVRLPYWTV